MFRSENHFDRLFIIWRSVLRVMHTETSPLPNEGVMPQYSALHVSGSRRGCFFQSLSENHPIWRLSRQANGTEDLFSNGSSPLTSSITSELWSLICSLFPGTANTFTSAFATQSDPIPGNATNSGYRVAVYNCQNITLSLTDWSGLTRLWDDWHLPRGIMGRSSLDMCHMVEKNVLCPHVHRADETFNSFPYV